MLSKKAGPCPPSPLEDIRFSKKTKEIRRRPMPDFPREFIHCGPFWSTMPLRITTVGIHSHGNIERRTSYYRLGPFKTAIKNRTASRIHS
jgi:hypothetical protein